MVIIGVTGGIASGKTFVAHELGRLGAEVLEADRIGHAVLGMPDVRAALWARWGEGVFRAATVGAEREVDRAAVAERVFAPPPDGPRELAFLEGLTHQLIGARIAERLEQLRRGAGVRAAVLDAPVLYKVGWDRLCDHILFVEAPWEVRLARAAQRGWSRAQLQARQAAQPPLEDQRRRADVRIDNGGSPEHTIVQIEKFWQSLADEHTGGGSEAGRILPNRPSPESRKLDNEGDG
jgi:dephospho-CoA kinase